MLTSTLLSSISLPCSLALLLPLNSARSICCFATYLTVGGFPAGWDHKESACNAGDLGLIPGSGRFPWRRKWQPTPVFLPGKSHEWRSLGGYSLWGCKESDMTERLHFHSDYQFRDQTKKASHWGKDQWVHSLCISECIGLKSEICYANICIFFCTFHFL